MTIRVCVRQVQGDFPPALIKFVKNLLSLSLSISNRIVHYAQYDIFPPFVRNNGVSSPPVLLLLNNNVVIRHLLDF